MPALCLLSFWALAGTLWALPPSQFDGASLPPDSWRPAVSEFRPGARGFRPFSFAILTDLHVGDGAEDFGSPGFDDALGAGLPADPSVRNARAAVEKVNSIAAAQGVAFVIVLGDLTDSAERSEFAAAKLLLDGLRVPYVPVLGNHDIWPATKAGMSASPDGPRYFEESFGPRLQDLAAAFPDLVRAGSERGLRSMAFSHRGVAFILPDWNSRGKADGGPDPGATLHDYEGGTFRWLAALLRGGWTAPMVRVFLAQHHPFRMKVPFTSPGFAFSHGERARIKVLLDAPGVRSRLAAVLSGHEHRDFVGPAFPDWPELAQIEAAAVKDGPAVTVISVASPTDYSLSRR